MLTANLSVCYCCFQIYSSVCYTSVQLLKPLAVYKVNGTNVHDKVWSWQTYLSPTVQYFCHHHLFYGIIAILCELVIGIGLPLVILTQRYLIRYFNLKLISIKPVIDQLQGCYKEEYRWFAAYYLICRQLFYWAAIITTIASLKLIIYTLPVMLLFHLTVCLLILTIYLWFQLYKRKSLNAFDTVILVVLVLTVYSGFEANRFDMGNLDVRGFCILPLLFFINYLALSSKLKDMLIPISCGGMVFISLHYVFGSFQLLVLVTFCGLFLAYLIFVIRSLYVKIRHSQTQYAIINDQDDNFDEDSDT